MKTNAFSFIETVIHPRSMVRSFRGKLLDSFITVVIWLLIMILLPVFSVQAQTIVLKGKVVNSEDEPVVGATVRVKNSSVGTAADQLGKFLLEVRPGSDSLVISAVGYFSQTIEIGGVRDFNVQLVEDVEGQKMNELVVVGFGTQKKKSIVSSVTTINPKELRGPTSNLTNMLAGRVSGLIAFQRSGEPGADNAQFFIRGLGSFSQGKRDPLILIDGIESSTLDIARLQPDDISSFSVLKDATAAAVYGARGANGVILVTTKSGAAGATKFDIRVENKLSSNTSNFKFADNITYMELANEAALTRNPLAGVIYSQNKIDRTKANDDPYLFPNNDWIKLMIKDYTMNQSYNLSFSGGTNIARYYIAGTYTQDNGVLKVDKMNNFNNNVKLSNYSVRSNVNVNLTPTTEAIVRVYGQFDDYSGPIGGGTYIFNQVVWSNPVMFPATYPREYLPYAKHALFGNAIMPGTSNMLFNNPYANVMKGYSEYKTSNMQAQLEIKQKLDFITKGLSARLMSYTKRYANFSIERQYNPFYYNASFVEGAGIVISPLNDGGPGSVGIVGTEYLDYKEGIKWVNATFYTEVAADYNQDFGKHNVSGMLIGLFTSYQDGNAGSLQSSLPHRNQGISGRFTYGYDNRYFTEFNFGYNGSERFARNNRWGFFPSFGAAWTLSNEDFFKPVKGVIDNFKLRATYGWVGNDAIGNPADRFFYLSNVNMDNPGYGFAFGDEWKYWRPGISISRYPNDKITWERSRQINLGTDISFFRSLSFVVDVYNQQRSNILLNRTYIPTTMGLQAPIVANVGKAESKGLDLAINYNKNFTQDFWLQTRATMTYATSKILVHDEPVWPDSESYRYRVGRSIDQIFGYIAERLFVDEREVANAPRQNFGEYMGGDIKYRDMNRDGQITSEDMVPMGFPRTPEIIYGFGNSMGYKGFDLSFFLQGSARSSFTINPWNISPFVTNGSYQNGLLKVIAEDHWSEENRNLYAFWPRLSDYQVGNNNQVSSWWLRSGAFVRVKTIEFGYNFPASLLERVRLKYGRVYINTMNPFVISNFKLWDPEMGGNGLGYPIQKSYNLGLNIRF